MANTVLIKALPTFFFFFSFFIQTKQDSPCPYPCYPPPTGPGGGGSSGGGGIVTQTPPASYSPPSQSGAVYPPPTGNLPYYTQPPPYGGSSFYGQPPPDPILPYFPFYYRRPPHRTDDQTSGTAVRPGKSRFIITATSNFLVFIILVIIF
ncbi:putative TPX2 family protein [Hibiscus syriacus]|uniref:TPX2 family protein n=1 Tax=Hibiscus syriacus TaxID=106335 RepID=A0A6A2X0H0_HIBSY|nr:basic salivary proline-rich protein 4-like [Hibiscus syriacus]KAE8667731.1 putative TPX2 family protein [Hibiscus syriacus]